VGQGKRTFFLNSRQRWSNALLATASMESGLSNALLALDLIESRERLSTGELLAPVLLEQFLPFSSYELLAPLSA
jgi:hypothetical protein